MLDFVGVSGCFAVMFEVVVVGWWVVGEVLRYVVYLGLT